MVRTVFARASFAALVLVLLIGAVDAALEAGWDQFVLFVIAAILSVGLAAQVFGARPLLSMRRDLLRWAQQRSNLTGEPVERLVDRAVATYRSQIGPADDA